MLRRTWAEVHLDALEHNVRLLQRYLSRGCRMMGIVKADAYGHGAVTVARRMEQCGVTYFGVSNLDEAIELRHAGITQPILVIAYTPSTEVAQLAEYHVTQTVLSAQHAAELEAAAAQAGVCVTVHIKVDTGMSRVGFVCHEKQQIEQTADDIAAVCRLRHLRHEGIFTHFPSADELDDGGFTRHQFELFTALIDALDERGMTFSLRHCCNSAALIRYPEMHLDMVRPGIVQFGLYPADWMQKILPDLRPVIELKTSVSMVKELPAGVPLSYNRTFTTASPRRVATVPIGYADGYSRRMSNRAYMLINGYKAPVLGRVCMDQCMLDVTDIPAVHEGSVVTVYGNDADAVLPIDQIAAWMDSIHYEVVCSISRRVPRLYFDGEKQVELIHYLLDD